MINLIWGIREKLVETEDCQLDRSAIADEVTNLELFSEGDEI